MAAADEMIRMAEYPVAGNWDWVQMKECVVGGDNIVRTNPMTSTVGWKQLTQLSVQVEGDETVLMEKGGDIATLGVGGDDQVMIG